MERFYSLLGSSRQNFGKRLKYSSDKKVKEALIISSVKSWRENHPEMGSRIMYHSMSEAGFEIPIGITAFEKLMSQAGLTVKRAKKYGPYTSDGKGKKDYPNLANGLKINGINQLLAGGITYFWAEAQWCYLFVLKDLYSQRLVSLIPSLDMKADHAVSTLKELVRLRGVEKVKGAIHQSDNGSQYESKGFTKLLTKLEMKISRANNCKENGSCEQMNHIIKNMYLRHFGVQTFDELSTACKKVKRLMNEQRAIDQLGNKTVIKFEQHIETLMPDQRPVKTLHDFS